MCRVAIPSIKKKNTVKDKREWTTGRGKLVLMSDSGSSQEK